MKVLLATDGSQYSDGAAWLLAHLSHAQRMDLTILSATQLLKIQGAPGVEEWYQKSLQIEKEKALAACKRVEAMFEGADAEVRSVVLQGNPSEVILDEAAARGAELIVVGAVGHSNLDRMLLGSVSDYVATHAHCSVLVVRPTGLQDREHKDLKICVAYDDSAASNYAIDGLEQFLWAQHTHFDILNVFTTPQLYTDIPVQFDVEGIRSAMAGIAESGADKVRKYGGTAHSHTVDAAHVGEGIVRFTKERASDLLVMGDTGRSMLSRFLLGSVSKYALRHSPCSVWIQRQPQA